MKPEHMLGKISKYALIGLAVGVVGTGILTWMNGGVFGDLASAGLNSGAPFDEQRTLAGQNVKKLAIETGSSDVILKPGTVQDVQVHLRGHGDLQKILERYEFNVEQNGDTAHIEFRQKSFNWSFTIFQWGQAVSSADLEITVPKKMYDELMINVSSGDVDVDSLKSDELIAEASSGDLRLQNVTGKVQMQISSGSAELRMAELTKDVEIDISSGDVTVYAPKSSSFEFEGRTSSGDIEVNFPNTTIRSEDKHIVRGTVGSGGPKIDMEASSGDIELKSY